MNAAALDVSRLEKVRTRGAKTIARCPACAESDGDHEGEHLVIDTAGRFGCVKYPGESGNEHRKRIFALVGVVEKSEPAPQRKTRNWKTALNAAEACTPEGYTMAAVYDYPKDGKPFAAVARYENATGKTFRQFRANGDRWESGGPAGLWPLFTVEGLPAAGPVHVFEGEKCAIAADAVGLAAVSSAGGANAAAKTDWTPLAGRDVRIWPDADEPGEVHAEKVAGILSALTPPARVKFVRLGYQIGTGKDIADYLAEGKTAHDLKALIAAAPEWQTQKTSGTPAAIDAAGWFDSEPPPPRFILDGTIEGGDKGSVIAKSKERKSTFTLQLALCVAAGKPFLCWDVPRPHRVLLVQFEIKAVHFHRRFRFMAAALALSKQSLGDRLAVVNARGWGSTGPAAVAEIGVMAQRHKAELVIIDPLYKVCEGDENKAADMKPTLAAFDQLAEAGAAVLYVHHDAKGDAGARAIQDRGAGTSVTGRDDDFRFVLAPHETEQGGAVLETMRRNFKPQDPVTIRWDDRGCFEFLSDVAAVKQTKPTTNRPPLTSYHAAAVKLLSTKPLPVADFKARLQALPGVSRDRARELVYVLTEGDAAPLMLFEERRKGFHSKVIGTREQIERLERPERREA